MVGCTVYGLLLENFSPVFQSPPMKDVQHIAYRFLTGTDFFNIYKQPGTEAGGGGQTYIDFPTGAISIEKWEDFFSGITDLEKSTATNGPQWIFPINSIGLTDSAKQKLKMYARQPTRIVASSQSVFTSRGDRILAWHPDNEFPKNPEWPNPMQERSGVPRGLAVFLVRTLNNEIWAGWFMNGSEHLLTQNEATSKLLSEILDSENEEGDAGFLSFDKGILMLDEANDKVPFITEVTVGSAEPASTTQRQRVFSNRQRSEEEITEMLFDDDEDQDDSSAPMEKMIVVRTKRRNKRAVSALKELYGHKCQITGDEFLFKKRDGIFYTEAHHLIPLGKGGADSPRNMIILDPRVHRMLHYADVEGIDLSNLQEQEDGSATLEIKINGDSYIITWHPKHIEHVKKFEDS